ALTGTNDAPVVQALHADGVEGAATPLSIDLLAGATDVDLAGSQHGVGGFHDTLSVTKLDALPTWATLRQDGHTPTPYQTSRAFDDLKEGEHGSFNFNFNVDDGHGGVVGNTLTVDIVGTNDIPTATPLHINATETASDYNAQHQITNLGSDIKSIDLLQGANDKDGDNLSVVI